MQLRLDEQRAKEKQERLARMHKLLAANNTGVTSFYKVSCPRGRMSFHQVMCQ
jgi:hypothetical protein